MSYTVIDHERAYGFVSDAVRSVPKPHPFVLDVVDYGFIPAPDNDTRFHTFALRVYVDDWSGKSNEHQVDIAEWVQKRLETIALLAPDNVRVGFEMHSRTEDIEEDK